MKLTGGGKSERRCDGVVEVTLRLDEDPVKCIVSEERDKNRWREPKAAEAAFFVIEMADIVVCAKPERVISTLSTLPNINVYRLLLVGV